MRMRDKYRDPVDPSLQFMRRQVIILQWCLTAIIVAAVTWFVALKSGANSEVASTLFVVFIGIVLIPSFIALNRLMNSREGK